MQRGFVRYFKYGWEVILGPVIFSLLFMTVFVLAAEQHFQISPGVDLGLFLALGLVIYNVAYVSFQYAAFTLLDDKIEGMIWDFLMVPLRPIELMVAYVLTAALNATFLGLLLLGIFSLLIDIPIKHLGLAFTFLFLTAIFGALLGTLTGMWAERWENYAMAENFLVLPLGFLSGSFFSLQSLPELAQKLVLINPLFHAVDGFRYGFLDNMNGSLQFGIGYLLFLNFTLAMTAWWLFAIGYKIKN